MAESLKVATRPFKYIIGAAVAFVLLGIVFKAGSIGNLALGTAALTGVVCGGILLGNKLERRKRVRAIDARLEVLSRMPQGAYDVILEQGNLTRERATLV